MITEIPVFMKINDAYNALDAFQILDMYLSNHLPDIKVYPAYLVDGETIEPAAAFNITAEDVNETKEIATKILAIGIGSFDYVSIKFCGQGAHCCFAVVLKNAKDIAEILHGYFSAPEKKLCKFGIMERNKNLCYVVGVLDPEKLRNKNNAEQDELVRIWQSDLSYILKYLESHSIDFMQIGYQQF